MTGSLLMSVALAVGQVGPGGPPLPPPSPSPPPAGRPPRPRPPGRPPPRPPPARRRTRPASPPPRARPAPPAGCSRTRERRGPWPGARLTDTRLYLYGWVEQSYTASTTEVT